VAGSELIHLSECVSWVNLAPKKTIVFLDRMLEYPEKCLDGLDLISEFGAQGALVVIRSGNDSDEDMALYMARGAFGSISKVLHGEADPDIVKRARVRIADQYGMTNLPNSAQQRIRTCVLDDQLGARMSAVKLIKMVVDGYSPPPKLKALEAVWEDDDA